MDVVVRTPHDMPIESNHTNHGTTVVVQSDLGDFSLDLAEVEQAQRWWNEKAEARHSRPLYCGDRRVPW